MPFYSVMQAVRVRPPISCSGAFCRSPELVIIGSCFLPSHEPGEALVNHASSAEPFALSAPPKAHFRPITREQQSYSPRCLRVFPFEHTRPLFCAV